jgi:hypothetical protein
MTNAQGLMLIHTLTLAVAIEGRVAALNASILAGVALLARCGAKTKREGLVI